MISSSSSYKGCGGGRQINKALEVLPKNAGFDSERDSYSIVLNKSMILLDVFHENHWLLC